MAKKVKYKSLLSGKELVLITLFFLAVLFLSYLTFFTPNYYSQIAPVTFEVKKGESFSHITNRLYNEHIIPSKLNFKIAGIIYGAQSKIRPDRKSTRLNSSHLGISYAVFCLKKKNTK